MISASTSWSRAELNRLYNLLDLCLVSSRWEGGPHTLIEACFAKTKILSTRVGIAEDVLERGSLFDTIPEAVSRILEDTGIERWKRPGNLNIAGCSRRIPRRSSRKPCVEFTKVFLRTRRKQLSKRRAPGSACGACALLRRRRSPPRCGRIAPRKIPGEAFRFSSRNTASVLRNRAPEHAHRGLRIVSGR